MKWEQKLMSSKFQSFVISFFLPSAKNFFKSIASSLIALRYEIFKQILNSEMPYM